jgi:hypothetical protein
MRVIGAGDSLPKTGLFAISLLALTYLIGGCGGGSIAVNLNTIAAISAPADTLRVNRSTWRQGCR